MTEIMANLSNGAIIGFCAGVAPGPLTILVITQTIRFGLREGIKVGIAPVLTDIPIIFLSVWAISTAKDLPLLLALLSAGGSVFLLMMARANWSAPMLSWEKGPSKPPRSILHGVTTNLLNPHPYLFWMTIGAPIILKSPAGAITAGISFALPMFAMMVGIKVLMAWIAREAKKSLTPRRYRILLGASSALLLWFSASFAWSAWEHLRNYMGVI